MKNYRLLSLLTAFVFSSAFYSCSSDDMLRLPGNTDESFSEESDVSETDKLSEKYNMVELDTVKEHILQLEEDAGISGNSQKLQQDIDVLINDFNAISEALSYLTIDFYCDWNNEELEEMYDNCYETYYVAAELLNYAFSNAYMVEEYSDMLEPYILEDYLEYFTDRSMSMRRIEGYARVDFEVMDEHLDKYYDIVNNEEMSDDEKNLAAAEIYLELLSTYDTETFYENYNRDFTAEEIIALSETVYSELIPAVDAIEEAFLNNKYSEDTYNSPILFDNVFEKMSETAPSVSQDIGKSAALLCSDKLYTSTSGENVYTGSFTIDLPVQNRALIYNYQYDDCYDMTTAIHEFGHFYASFYDDTPSFLALNNIDIAEVQSQGMEILFMPHYGDFYGKQSDAMRLLKLYDTLESAVTGFLVGEFEYTILKNIETITPEEVVEYFDSLMSEYGYETDFYYISHVFEQPGYYISYGVSALAALNIWQTSVEDYDAAVSLYENIAHIKCNSPEYQFSSALSTCGFDNVLDESYISILADDLIAYAESET